ncbi:uncharacterized protein LOC135847902 [Planococcus citri]|uniref:uncharacterized protein LOC135847902 n=1 Tax=Planococcus citri TaxID=170843 RepID=UPI0031F80E91
MLDFRSFFPFFFSMQNDRDPEDTAYTTDDVKNKAESLKKEYPDWKETRDELENTLIRKNLQFGFAVMEKFKADLNITVADAIKQKIKNHDLVDAYTSLAQYVNDKHDYMATVMLRHSNGHDRWAVWIMMIGITTRDDWPKIDDAFKKINNGVSLTDHLLKVNDPDRIPFEMMAAMIDPKYKPTYL